MNLNPAGKLNINFIPDDVVKTRKLESAKNSGNKLLVSLALITMIVAAGIYGYNFTLHNKINNITSQIASKNQEVNSLKEFGKDGYKIGIRLRNAKDIVEKRKYYSNVYADIITRIPEGIKIVSWTVTDQGDLQFTGEANTNYSVVADFRNSLLKPTFEGAIPYYSDAKLISSNYDKSQGKINFVLQITLDPARMNSQTN